MWAAPESLHRAVTALERRGAALEAAALLELLSAGVSLHGVGVGTQAASAAAGGGSAVVVVGGQPAPGVVPDQGNVLTV